MTPGGPHQEDRPVTLATLTVLLSEHRQAVTETMTQRAEMIRQHVDDGFTGIRMQLAEISKQNDVRDSRLVRIETSAAGTVATLDGVREDTVRNRDAAHKYGNVLERHEADIYNHSKWIAKVEERGEEASTRVAAVEGGLEALPERFRALLKDEASSILVPLRPAKDENGVVTFTFLDRLGRLVLWVLALFGAAGAFAAWMRKS